MRQDFVANFRPISLILSVLKIIEEIVLTRVNLEFNPLLLRDMISPSTNTLIGGVHHDNLEDGNYCQ